MSFLFICWIFTRFFKTKIIWLHFFNSKWTRIILNKFRKLKRVLDRLSLSCFPSNNTEPYSEHSSNTQPDFLLNTTEHFIKITFHGKIFREKIISHNRWCTVLLGIAFIEFLGNVVKCISSNIILYTTHTIPYTCISWRNWKPCGE